MSEPRSGPDPQLVGIGIAVIGMMILTLTPPLGSWVDIPQGLARTLLWLGVALLFAGAAVPLVHGWRNRG